MNRMQGLGCGVGGSQAPPSFDFDAGLGSRDRCTYSKHVWQRGSGGVPEITSSLGINKRGIEVNCVKPGCGAVVPAEAKFCLECGAPVGEPPKQSVSNSGGAGRDIHQYQAGRDLIFYPQVPSSASTTPQYDVKWSWRSPLTLAALTWISVLLGILSLGSGYKVFEPLISAFVKGAGLEGMSEMQPVWIFVLLGLFLVFAVAMTLRRIAKNETQHLSRFGFLPAITGWGRRIGLARLRGKCQCGGRLRFYSKAVAWSQPDPQTGKQRVTDRDLTAECVRDPKHHVWRIEMTDSNRDS